MVATIRVVLSVMMIETAVSLKYLYPIHEAQPEGGGPRLGDKSLRRVLASLANAKLYITSGDRKSIDPVELTKAKSLLEILGRSRYETKRRNYLDLIMAADGKDPKSLRADKADPLPVVISNQPKETDQHQHLVETELQDAMSHPKSALLNKAWVQKRGRNDFLVLEDEAQDPYVTVIPNNIYYNIEKKCVNWMDDCSLQGIRMKLLQRVQSPYRR